MTRLFGAIIDHYDRWERWYKYLVFPLAWLIGMFLLGALIPIVVSNILYSFMD